MVVQITFRYILWVGGVFIKEGFILDTGISSVAVITVVCYLIAQGVKATPLDNKWLPVICGVFGAFMGYIGLTVMPNFPASDPLTAVAVGIVSGLAATGSHQIFKQLTSYKSYEEGTEDEDDTD